MAAGILQPPGSKFGPCKEVCNHRDCAATRAQAAALCAICQKAIDYGVQFYADAGTYTHADCEECEAEKDRQFDGYDPDDAQYQA